MSAGSTEIRFWQKTAPNNPMVLNTSISTNFVKMHYKVLFVGNNYAMVEFTVTNSSTISSATHPPVIGYTKFWNTNIGKPLNDIFQNGPMSQTKQTFIWKEMLEW